MIEVKNICKSFDGRSVLKEVSFTVPDSGIFGIFGPSGSGKTTLLRIIAGLEKADSGEVLGTQGKKIAFMFQEDRLICSCSARKNVALVSDDKSALEYLSLAGLGEEADKFPGKMSGGMKRRAALARALAYGGDILILDEPLKGIERELRKKIEQRIKTVSQSVPVILVTHDEEEKLLADSFVAL